MEVLRKYNEAATILFPLIDRGTLDFENTPVTFVAADTQISKDEGAFANTGSTPVHEGNGFYSLALTATEMSAARIMITVIDSATKLWEDQAIVISTYGNASAQHEFDLDKATQSVTLADAAHGGTAAVLTLERIAVVATTTNASAITATGDGTGSGLEVIGGGTGEGLECKGGATGGAGIKTSGGGISGPAIEASNASGDCVTIAAGGGNGDGLAISGNGTGVSVSSPDGMFDLVKEIWDRVLTGATHNVTNSSGRRVRLLEEGGTYDLGAVYIDTVNGTAGATDFENGTVLNPVLGIADALTLMASLNLTRLIVTSGSTITLAAAFANKVMTGTSYTLALGGQSITGSVFSGASVSGNDSGANATRAQFVGCEMGTSILGKHLLADCLLSGVITLAEATDYEWAGCISDAGTTNPAVDFESAAETKSLALRTYAGGIELRNHGAGGGTHTTDIGGEGALVIAASCVGGTVTVAGHFSITKTGTVTFSEVASFESIKDDGTTAYDRLTDSLQEQRDNVGTLGAALTDLGGMSTGMKAEVNAEVVDVLKVDTVTLPGQLAPPLTPTFEEMQAWLYKLARNKIRSSATVFELFDDAGTTVDAKATQSDSAGVFTVEEMESGP